MSASHSKETTRRFATPLLQGRISLRYERKHAQRKLEEFRGEREKKNRFGMVKAGKYRSKNI